MSTIKPINSSYIETGSLGRFIPEPKSSLNFGNMLRGLSSLAGGALTSMTGLSGMDSSFQSLIAQQIQVQQEMQIVSMVSNVEKSRHETQMAAIRNIRVG